MPVATAKPRRPISLTPQQSRTLAAFAALRRRNGYSPSLRELAKEMGLSMSGVNEHVLILKAKGALGNERRYGWRCLTVLRPDLLPARKRLIFPVLGTLNSKTERVRFDRKTA